MENANLKDSEEHDVETKLASTHTLEDDILLDVIEVIHVFNLYGFISTRENILISCGPH